jgi:ParB family chromosome partitioning protein
VGGKRAAKSSTGETKPKKATTRKPRKPKPAAPKPLTVREVSEPSPPHDLAAVVEADGGAVLARYREPYGGHDVLLVALPISKVEPTPFQRDVSPAHVKKLARSIEKVGRFLDPVLAVHAKKGEVYWVPNGGHRLAALKEAGASTITALLVPEPEVAHKILALNTEKAHNLKERSLEVVRLERVLVAGGETKPEKEFDLELEEGALVTLGLAYEQRPRLAGGAYAPLLRRVDPLLDEPIKSAFARREGLAKKLLDADELVAKIVEALKARGFKSPYLRPFVVARLNPANRFVKTLPASAEEALEKLIENAKKFDPERVRETDVATASGPPPSEEET